MHEHGGGSGIREGAAAAGVFLAAALPATRPSFLDKRAAEPDHPVRAALCHRIGTCRVPQGMDR